MSEFPALRKRKRNRQRKRERNRQRQGDTVIAKIIYSIIYSFKETMGDRDETIDTIYSRQRKGTSK